MKLSTVLKKLGNFRQHEIGGVIYFTSRAQGQRFVKVWDKGNGICTALPITVDANGEERVAFHPRSVKALAEFIAA